MFLVKILTIITGYKGDPEDPQYQLGHNKVASDVGEDES
jgi:hypothetical protein